MRCTGQQDNLVKGYDMSQYVIEGGTPTRFAASAIICTVPASLLGLFISNASSSPTLEVQNADTSGSGTVVGSFVPVSGSFYAMPMSMSAGITLVCTGSVSGAAIWNSAAV